MIRNVRKAYVDNIKSNAFSSRDLAYMFYIRDRCATGPSIFLRGDVQDVWRVPAFGTLGKELGYWPYCRGGGFPSFAFDAVQKNEVGTGAGKKKVAGTGAQELYAVAVDVMMMMMRAA